MSTTPHDDTGHQQPWTTPPPAPPVSERTRGFFNSIRGWGLYRSTNRHVGGVAGGLAARTGVDPLLIRGLAFVLILVFPFLLSCYGLAWLLLPDLPEYRTGLIIVGLARCIAMVIIWNDLACGDREAAAVLVALNSVFQVIAFAGLGWFYLSVLPGWLGLEQAGLDVSAWQIAKSVLIFLGIPLLLGYLSRKVGEQRWGRTAYETSFLPRVGPWALYGLLFTVVIMFALQGDQITSPGM